MNRFSATDFFDLYTSLSMTAIRAGQGVSTRPRSDEDRPALLLELWDFEACPYCRLVREALTELDLDALIHPCPKGGTRQRQALQARGGKQQVPYLYDPNTGFEAYESADIVAYLHKQYGSGSLPLRNSVPALQVLNSTFAGMLRAHKGGRAHPARSAEQPLELYSFESSPYARLVRERLSELELDYIVRSVGRSDVMDWIPPSLRQPSVGDQGKDTYKPSQSNRKILLGRTQGVSIPYLIDPNTGEELAETDRILDYLNETYAAQAAA